MISGNGSVVVLMDVNWFTPLSAQGTALVQNIQTFLATGGSTPPTTTVALDGSNNLIVTDSAGGNTNDTLTIRKVNVAGLDYIRVQDPNNLLGAGAGSVQFDTHTVDTLVSSVASNVQVNTLDGNDLLTVDSSMVSTGKPITFNGGLPSTAGPPGDAMVLSGPGTFANVKHSFSNAADGSVDIGGYIIQYFGLEPVTDVLTATTRTFTFTGIGETVTLADSGAAGDTMSVISSTEGESVTFANPTGTLTINLTNGTDTLNFNSLDSMEAGPGVFSADLVINGDGSDIVNFPSALINLGAGTANIGTTGGQPIQTINFTGGGLQATSTVSLTAAGAITTSTAAVDVVASGLTAVTATGIDMDTTVATITASASSAGNIRFDETNGVTLTSVTTFNGSITVNAGGTVTATNVVNTTDASNVITIVTTAGDILANNIVAPGDTITLNAAGAIEESGSDGTSDISASLVNLTAATGVGGLGTIEINTFTNSNRGLTASVTGAGLVDLSDVTGGMRVRSVTTTNGNIALAATSGDLIVESISAGSGGDVALTASGAISDGNAATLNVSGDLLLAIAATGISLDTTVNNVEATCGSGGVDIEETNGLIIGGVSVPVVGISVTGGNIAVTAAGPLTVNEAVVNSGIGTVDLSAAGSGGGGAPGPVAITGYNITAADVTGSGGWNHTYSGTITPTGGTRANYTGGTGTMADGVFGVSEQFTQLFADFSGPISDPVITLFLPGSFSLNTIDIYGGNFGPSNSIPGRITGFTVTIGANSAAFASTGFGAVGNSGQPINDRVTITGSPLDGIAGTTVILSNFTEPSSQAFSITEIILDGQLGTGGSVVDDLSLNANVTASGGSVTLNAASDILQNGVTVVSTTGSGLVDYNAGTGTSNGVITMADGTSATSGTGLISLDADGNIQVSLLQTGSAAGNAVTVTTTAGAITDADAGAALDVSAVNGGAILSAATGVGAAGVNATIEVQVINLDVHNNTSGGIFVTDTALGLTLTNLSGPTSVSGMGGNGLITALSPLTIAASAITAGGMTYTATDGGGAGDNLSISAGVAVTDTTAALTFNAGDDFVLTNTASISAATTATINIDF
ncbi:MAG: beta strand repeat-containing protein, partial [Pirellulaceae bacterium]